jgi:hypothetical protein
MQTLAIALPLVPGGRERLLQLREIARGERREEHDDFFRRHVFKENWYLQSTPNGDMVILYLETDDIGRLFGSIAATTHPYDHWHLDRAVEIHGVDFRKPPGGPLPEVLFEGTLL